MTTPSGVSQGFDFTVICPLVQSCPEMFRRLSHLENQGLTAVLVAFFLSMAGAAGPVWSGEAKQIETNRRVQQLLATGLEAYDGGDFPLARESWRRAASLGSTDAMTALANMYAQGEGVAPDPARAAQWYRRAARFGDPIGQLNLGDMHRRGFGVRRSPTEALFWLTLAGRGGNAWAAAEAAKLAASLPAERARAVTARAAAWRPSLRPPAPLPPP